jgi:hypothetical protein
MRRCYLPALFIALSLGLVMFSVHGCSNETAFESICDWIANPNNCYREFRAGMLEDDGGPSALGPGCTFAGPQPTDADDKMHPPGGTQNGAFPTGQVLTTCIIDSGGSVTFDPPINLAAYPPSLTSTPVTYTITLADPFGVACGKATYTSPHGFSISIAAPAGAGGGGSTSAGGDGASDGGFQAVPAFGTYTQTIAPGRDAFDVTCPSGETHHFNLDEAEGFPNREGQDVSACPGYKDLVPSASLQIHPGSVDRPGAVSFAIVYPDVAANAAYPPFQASTDTTASFNPDAKNVPPPQAVVYFNCATPPTCMDGAKDGTETDVDCGGPAVEICPARCEGGHACNCDGDCASRLCVVDPMSGMRTCAPPTSADAGVTDAGTGAGACSYVSVCVGQDAGAVCPDAG